MFEYTDPVKPHWITAAQDSFEDIKQAILLDPCLMRFNHQRLIVLHTDFSTRGFGYVLCQPGNDEASTSAMNAYQSSTDFSFMTKSSTAALTQLRSAPDVAVATKFVYTPTWARDFQGTMQLTNAATTSLVNDLFGSPTATQ